MKSIFYIFLLVFANFVFAEEADTKSDVSEGKVLAYLVHGNNESDEGVQCVDIEEGTLEKLRKSFPEFASFKLLGKHNQELFKQYETWIVPSLDFFLKLDSKGPSEKGGIKTHLQIWHNKEVILKCDPVLYNGRHIIVAGPKWREGRLFLLLQLVD